MPELLLGIDFASPNHTSGYALLDTTGALLDVGLIGDDAAILDLIDRTAPTIVAIDCPLGLPAGLDCLDPACACTPSSAKGIRESELAVRALGYGLYFTTKKTIIRAMAERGIALRRVLEARGLQMIEVYPYATKCVLFGKKMPKKTTPEGAIWLRARIATVVPSLAQIARTLTHDELDAIVAAHTALLYVRGDAVELGNTAEGGIVVPRTHGPASPDSQPGTAVPLGSRRE